MGVITSTVGKIFKRADEANVLDHIQTEMSSNGDSEQQSTDCLQQSTNGGVQRGQSFTNNDLQTVKDSLSRLRVNDLKDLLRKRNPTL